MPSSLKSDRQTERGLVIGTEILAAGAGVHFRLWAPLAQQVSVIFENGDSVLLSAESDGYFAGNAPDAKSGDKYKYRLNEGEAFPDPASKYQPDGPHGFSQIVDATTFLWSDDNWKGIRLEGQVIYEIHLGTFTSGGTWGSASEKLTYLKETGITLIEVMPVAEFPGKYGWGYDGVQLFAPASIYGTPDDMRRFIDQAHQIGLGVILDVVYNHLGPDGNYLGKYSDDYFTDKHKTDWGRAINFDGHHCGPVREYFLANAGYWIREFHLDGLRLDATQDIHDDCQPHILAEINQAARLAAGKRSIVLIGENEPQDTRLIKPLSSGGYGLDGLWNDDYHHSAMVALTGKADAYYTDYRGTAQEFLSAVKYGYLYQGQFYQWQEKRRGSSTLGLPRASMITFIQNHDQIANSARGQRIHELTSPGMYKALMAVTLLAPGTPLLFQGQEFQSSSRFLFFADHKTELAEKIREGRRKFLAQWRSLRLPYMQSCFDDPAAKATFARCILDYSEVEAHAAEYALHRDLLRLRREDPVISKQGSNGIDGAILSESCFIVRYFSPTFESDRLLVVNLGSHLSFNPAPEPLLAPPHLKEWETLWSSEEPAYGGCGTAALDSDKNWIIPGQAAVLLKPTLIQPPELLPNE
jgi:maltooligosyltrehalose trehalohydrolase